MAEPLKGTHKVTVFLSVSCQRRTLPCCSALNSLFIPNPNDVLNHAGVSSPLTGTKSRSGANSLQTVGLPHHLLHLLFQLLLLLLQATWRFELSSALLTSNLFSPVGSIGRYDVVCAQSVNNRTTQSYTAKLLQKNHITWTDRKMEKQIPRRTSSREPGPEWLREWFAESHWIIACCFPLIPFYVNVIPCLTPASHWHQIMRVFFLVISHQVIRRPSEFIPSSCRAHVTVGRQPGSEIIVSKFVINLVGFVFFPCR